MTPDVAGIRLRAGIELALKSHLKYLAQRAQENPSDANKIRSEMGYAHKLPNLFGDPALKDYYEEIYYVTSIEAP